MPKHRSLLESDPLWYKNAIIYELHVRAFADSNADGVGDFRGLRGKLDYLQDLGVTALWLLPFYPSPLRDDGYDIANYRRIHEAYGNLREFKAFLNEAHERGLRVITELVVNHTSDQHRWFQRARKAPPGSRWREFYVWSDTSEKYEQARIIFKDFESSNWTWDPVAEAYYWHRFYSHQPDLNFDNPEVHESLIEVMDFWLDMGVDGLRLDAIPYLYEREGTNCENLPETHEFLKKLRAHLDENYEDRMLLAEANQWPEDSVAYFGDGDECHMAFHFPLMPRLFMAIHQEDRFPILDIMDQTPEIPETTQWAIFLRNHDELTLEMVTDEERDYMYRVYAQDPQARINLGIRRRLAPLLGNNRRKIELMNGLLLSLPGTPVLYYGDEIGMGDNIYLGDRNGVRTPMQWSPDRNAGFSRTNPQKLYLPVIIDPEYHFETVNVEAQQNNPHSLLWWTKRLLALRKSHQAFSRGELEFLQPENRKVLAFTRRYEDELLLVIFNLSRYTQYVELDLSKFNGMIPTELFGHTRFPPIGELPYFVTLGPHAFYWFSLEPQRVDGEAIELAAVEQGIPTLEVETSWSDVFKGRPRGRLERLLPTYLKAQRWFGGKGQEVRSTQLRDVVTVDYEAGEGRICLVEVEYRDADAETYLVPLVFASGERAVEIARHAPGAVLAWVRAHGDAPDGVLFDALREGPFDQELLQAVAKRRNWKGEKGELAGRRMPEFKSLYGDGERLEANVLRAEQSNSAVTFGDRLLLKLFRRIEPGPNPDLEIGLFLTKHGFEHVPRVGGALEYDGGQDGRSTVAILQEYIASEGDAWSYTLDELGRAYERVLTRRKEEGLDPPPVPAGDDLKRAQEATPELVSEWVSTYLDTARLLGRRTAELHLALASNGDDPDFAPESLTKLRLRAVYQSMRSSSRRTLQSLRRTLDELPENSGELAQEVVQREDNLMQAFQALSTAAIDACVIRCHGDYHLGQVLYTGKDFVIIDFEGEPARPLSERRIKRSPLRDVAGMIRSFDYAAYSALRGGDGGGVRPEDIEFLTPWARSWSRWVAATFLGAYLEAAEGAVFLPEDQDTLRIMLRAYLLDKAVYEINYEMNNRPEWLDVPLRGLIGLLNGSA
ncbi:MAG: maltose alpha-D-glucosyltransferase [Anaerolineales bacterium]|nr:maltose alpha-D-glucosyltransferase [Anaerolineales bacterium]